jgi:ribonuclease HII
VGRAPAGRRRPLVHEGQELVCDRRFERAAARAGHRLVAGVDEVGRGALCGPVLACAVVLGAAETAGLDDSKRLTARQRERLAGRLRAQVQAWAVGQASVLEIDRLNILRATHLAMRRALEGLPELPDLALVDGQPASGLPCPQQAIVKGDARSVSIAAASILAKVERDALMRALDERFPGYGLASNAGYGSEAHRQALERLGPTPEHRRSFGALDQARLF